MCAQSASSTQDVVDTYLEDLILRSMERAADDEARDEVRRVADSLNEAAARIEAQCVLAFIQSASYSYSSSCTSFILVQYNEYSYIIVLVLVLIGTLVAQPQDH